jgi:hypothetical protein
VGALFQLEAAGEASGLAEEALDARVVRDAVVRPGTTDAKEMNHAVRLIELQIDPRSDASVPSAIGQASKAALPTDS